MEASQNRNFYGILECLPLWPTYIAEKGKALGKTCGIKARCYWEQTWGTQCEPDENPLGTRREHDGKKGKMKKIPPPPPLPLSPRKLKEK
jgi:hypothetical protein